ncbi:ATP-binding cassette sub-family C member 8 [Ceratobasidium sp. AG-Ba]|nr:ATP-binding cassette sub-family C member 8 [Ceratobasidium sp. AG-Ba]
MAQIEAKSWGAALSVPEGRCAVNLDESALRMLEPAQHRRNAAHPTYHSFKCDQSRLMCGKLARCRLRTRRVWSRMGWHLTWNSWAPTMTTSICLRLLNKHQKSWRCLWCSTLQQDASKAASRSRSRASPTTQPVAIPPVTVPPPKPTPAPIAFPTAAEPPVSVPTPPLAKQPTPPPRLPEDAEEGELELEPVSVPLLEQNMAMDVDEQADDTNGEMDSADTNGILPWEAVTATAHRRTANAKSTFTTADGPDEEVIDFGGSFGTSTRDPPRKTQAKSGRSGGINFPKAGRARDPPPRPPPPPPVEPDPEDMFEMVEVVPEVEYFQAEMARQLGESSDEEEDEEDEDEEDGGEFGAELAQAMEAVTQDDSSDDDDSSSEEDD